MAASYEAVAQVSKYVATNYEKLNKNGGSFQGSGIGGDWSILNDTLKSLPALIEAIQPKG